MTSHLVRWGLASLCVVSLMGAQDGCGGEVTLSESLCKDSGGTWNTKASTASCWSPVCGQTFDSSLCPDTEGVEEVCQCPAYRPYWKDGEGCWSSFECSKKCQGVALSCDAIGADMDRCEHQLGCDSYGYPCGGQATTCEDIDNSILCNAQVGCAWK